ncbi:MAG: phosphoesterase [Phycisphaerae bacterium]|nr:phosphoesterase [Phycisphaerae bacterium]
MKTAIISDIHSNLAALEAVLGDIDQKGVDRIICLGDIIGYGPDPVECVDLIAQRCEWSLMGNHDFGVLYEPTNFNTAAEQAAYWTRNQLDDAGKADTEAGMKRWEFLGRLRVRVGFDGFLCVHGSPRRPINEYIFPEDAINSPVKMEQIFENIDTHCLVGHTHVPGVFTNEPDFYPPGDLDGEYTIREDEKAVINPGSVGQPRDLDPRASYAVIEQDNGQAKVRFHRLEYEVDRTVQRIRENAHLSDWLGERLLEGR